MTKPLARFLLVLSLLVLAAPGGAPTARAQAARDAAAVVVPPVQRELRAAWVAAVANIDWPSRPGLSTAAQQAELRAILDRAVATGLNAIILHVRPAADALYASPLEPWSEYLTGEQGVPPEPYYDPLAFAVAESHARGLELHAWFNPFRARHPSARSAPAASHVSRAHPEWVRSYGRHLWMDPGEPAVRRHAVRVAADVARRYDVDGVHVDDYFYPYKERDSTGALIDFPDSATYARYRAAGGTLGRDDWRRDNVNRFVRALYEEIKRVKPAVKVGVSPFGIWRPGTPPGVQGFDPYAEIYADSRPWLRNGWLDYFAPQLYYRIDSPQPFPLLLAWWAAENVKGRHLWPGMTTVSVGSSTSRSWSPAEILEQIRLVRAQPGVTGHIHWSEKGLHTSSELAAEVLLAGRARDTLCGCGRTDAARDTALLLAARRDSLVAALRATTYAEPALVPTSPWLGRGVAPPTPRVRMRPADAAGGMGIEIASAPPGSAWLWVVQTRADGSWRTRIVPVGQRRIALTRSAAEPRPDVVAVSAVNRQGRQGRPAVLRL